MDKLDKSICNCDVLLRIIENTMEAEKENCEGFLYQDLQALFDYLHYLRHDFAADLLFDRDANVLNISNVNTLDNELQDVEEKYFALFDDTD